MIEMYDHRDDPPESTKVSYEQFENVNVYREQPVLAQQLSTQLRTFFEKHRAQSLRRFDARVNSSQL